ncbi:MAG: discoidin domain-containing protein, partial [Tannerella sp.]|nr:discoidin domain-containing protein [Tannerella sp.]
MTHNKFFKSSLAIALISIVCIFPLTLNAQVPDLVGGPLDIERVAIHAGHSNGYRSPDVTSDTPVWLQIDLGRSIAIEQVKLFPDVGNNGWYGKANSRIEFPARFKIETAKDGDETFASPELFFDHTAEDCNGEFAQKVETFTPTGSVPTARYVRLTVTKMPEGKRAFRLWRFEVISTGKDVSANVNNASANVNNVSASVNNVSASVNNASADVNNASADVNNVSADVNNVSASVNNVSANVNNASADVNNASADVNVVSTGCTLFDSFKGNLGKHDLLRPRRADGEFARFDHPENVTVPETWKPVVPALQTPRNGVTVGGFFGKIQERNEHYLLNGFTVSDLARDFRERAGKPVPPKRDYRPDDDSPWLKVLGGSNAGRFLMGSGNQLRWRESEELRRRMNELVAAIDECVEPSGYTYGFPERKMLEGGEEGAYARSWLTMGLIEAG